MFALYYDRRHHVVMCVITGVFSSDEIDQHDRVVLNLLAGLMADGRPVRGLYDFTKVDALAIPISKINQRGQRPAIIDGVRVVAAPHGAAGRDFVSAISTQQRTAGHREPVVVASLEEAYKLLEIDVANFERVE